jgi:hypothetical protein
MNGFAVFGPLGAGEMLGSQFFGRFEPPLHLAKIGGGLDGGDRGFLFAPDSKHSSCLTDRPIARAQRAAQCPATYVALGGEQLAAGGADAYFAQALVHAPYSTSFLNQGEHVFPSWGGDLKAVVFALRRVR